MLLTFCFCCDKHSWACFVHLYVCLDDLGMLCSADESDFFRNLCLLDCIDQIIECYSHGHMGLSRTQSLFLFFCLDRHSACRFVCLVRIVQACLDTVLHATEISLVPFKVLVSAAHEVSLSPF